MSRAALETMLSVTGQEAFAASMQRAMGLIDEMAVGVERVSLQMAAASARMDTAFGARSLAGIRSYNRELGTMHGHLRNIVSMVGGGGLLTAFGLYEGVKNASKVATNQMQWQTEAGVPASQVSALARLAGRQGRLGISNIDAGQIIRQVESAYSGSVRANDPRMQSYLTNSSNLSAISGGRVTALDAATLLIPLLQADKTLKGDPTRAASIINAMVGSGNMQTQDALSILKTGAPAALSGLGVSMQDLAPFYAFGADTRSGQQAAPFARLLTTSFLNLARGGANKAGKADVNAAFGSQAKAIGMLQGPNGGVAAIDQLNQYLVKKYGSLSAPGAIQEQLDIFGGVRGGATPLSIFGNYGLFQQKNKQFTDLSDPSFYTNAARMAQLNPAQRAQVVKAGFSNALTDVGQAVLPALTQALPVLGQIVHELAGPAKDGLNVMAKAFGILANPIVLRVIEGLVVLKGISMVGTGIGSLQGRILTSGSMGSALGSSFLNPMAGYRSGLNGSMVPGLANTQVREMMIGPQQQAAGASGAFDRTTASAMRLRAALVGPGLMAAGGVALGAGIGYASTAGGGSLLAGGLTGALSGALMGMSAGPWGAAAGAVAGAAGAIIGHFHAMGQAAKANAQQVQQSINTIISSNESPAAAVAAATSGNTDLQLGLSKLGLTQGQIAAAARNPAQLAAWRKAAYTLKGNQGTQVRNLIDTLTGLPGAQRLADTVAGKQVAGFSAPSDKAILTWAELHGQVSNLNAYGRLITPSTSSITNSIRHSYADSHGLFFSDKTGFAPGGSTTVNVYPSEKMDEKALAQMVVEEMKKAGARR